MKEITKYIADDGTEFEDEDECLDYERTEKMKTIKGVKFFFENGKEISDYENFEDLLDRTFFIRITDKDDFDKFEEMLYNEISYYYGTDGWRDLENEIGLFFYDKDLDRWMNWDKQYDKLLEIRKKMGY